MITKVDIMNVYTFLRRNNNTIPDEVIDFVKDSALSKLNPDPVVVNNDDSQYGLSYELITLFLENYKGYSIIMTQECSIPRIEGVERRGHIKWVIANKDRHIVSAQSSTGSGIKGVIEESWLKEKIDDYIRWNKV